ncbi:MAG: Uncharacterized protein G01um1014107_190 [Parcubacteria group bacterium Gr01-1014_107]|nr:MAG: Uncharacterized protein G01um1014107_190 [Parcubacteria group bacterium Gr01-1014_107]
MDNQSLENLIKKAKVSLREEEKAVLRRNILLRMDSYKLPSAADSLEQPSLVWRFFSAFSFRYVLAALVPMLVLVSTVSAAQGSVPGDLLYPLKTGFNEKLPGLFYLTIQAKAKRETELLERRLKEALELASRGELTEERKQVVEEHFENHSQKVRSYVKSLESKKDFKEALTLQSDLEISLELHGKLLLGTKEASSEVKAVASKVAQELTSVSQEKVLIQKNQSQKPRPDTPLLSQERLNEARRLLAEVEEFYKGEVSVKPEASSRVSLNELEVTSSVEAGAPLTYARLIEEAREKIKEGEALLEVKLYQDATRVFDEAIKLLRKFKLAKESEVSLDVFNESGLRKEDDDKSEGVGEDRSEIEGESQRRGTVQGKFESRGNSITIDEIKKPEVPLREELLQF